MTTIDSSPSPARVGAEPFCGDSWHVHVAGDASATAAAVQRFDLAGHVLRAFAAFGAGDRVLVAAVHPADLPRGGAAVDVQWRLDDDEACVDARYAVVVQPCVEDGSAVTVATLVAADAGAQRRLLDGWFAVRSLAEAIGQRALAAIAADLDARAEAA